MADRPYQQEAICNHCGRLVDRLEMTAGNERNDWLKAFIATDSWRRHVRGSPACEGAGFHYGELTKKE
jgi:hypothetical protein